MQRVHGPQRERRAAGEVLAIGPRHPASPAGAQQVHAAHKERERERERRQTRPPLPLLPPLPTAGKSTDERELDVRDESTTCDARETNRGHELTRRHAVPNRCSIERNVESSCRVCAQQKRATARSQLGSILIERTVVVEEVVGVRKELPGEQPQHGPLPGKRKATGHRRRAWRRLAGVRDAARDKCL